MDKIVLVIIQVFNLKAIRTAEECVENKIEFKNLFPYILSI